MVIGVAGWLFKAAVFIGQCRVHIQSIIVQAPSAILPLASLDGSVVLHDVILSLVRLPIALR